MKFLTMILLASSFTLVSCAHHHGHSCCKDKKSCCDSKSKDCKDGKCDLKKTDKKTKA